MPSEVFKCDPAVTRGKLRGLPISESDRAIENLIQRNLLLGERIRRSARELGLAVFEIDGGCDFDAVYKRVVASFSLSLERL